MKFSEQWLREWVNPNIDSQTLLTQLTDAGLEVDTSEAIAGEFSHVVVGEIQSIAAHPEADRLRICHVNVGKEPLTIVTNLALVIKGMKLPVALIGATLPDGVVIKKTKLRGVVSQGMFCGADTLGMQDTPAHYLFPLPSDAPIGQDLREYLQLDDMSIDIELTPNRADCLSLLGVAREVAVANNSDVTLFSPREVAATITDTLPIELIAGQDCPRYVGRIIRDVNPQAITPLWMKEKLRRSGIHAMCPLVDVTHYVMLECGQPMHAFNLAKINEPIIIRRAKPQEQLTLLGGQTVTLREDNLVIADADHALAMAGIMGGELSAVDDKTHDIFLESAYFNPTSLMGKARRHGLHTDSSHRFERGVDPQLPRRAMERATQLLLDIVGGKAGPVCEKNNEACLPKPSVILLRSARVAKILGCHIADDTIQHILQGLGMQVKQQEKSWQVTPPSYRFDMQIEEDLIEEIARIYGYNHIPSQLPKSDLSMLPQSSNKMDKTVLSDILINRDYHEAMCYSFVSPKIEQLL
ncbi:MAG: phenylalanine--tRNA ligase subunit beta, partial [Gammaproteobacteria bacterium]|nr:phenylalanine--tRNA ligase subunit beta [Gammaproteobacteria bacterium]